MSLAIACSGGGNWCVSMLGFVHALHERGYKTPAASGVSFGTWAAYAAVEGQALGVLERMKRFREHFDIDLLKPWLHRTGPRQLSAQLFESLQQAVPTYASPGGELYIMAVELKSFRSVALGAEVPLARSLQAAMAMPPLPAVEVDGRVLRDAGLRHKYGLKPLIRGGYDKILCLGSFADGFEPRFRGLRQVHKEYRGVEVLEVVMPLRHRVGVAAFTRESVSTMEALFEDGYRLGIQFPSERLEQVRRVQPRVGTAHQVHFGRSGESHLHHPHHTSRVSA